MSTHTHIPGGEVTIHPGPKHADDGIKTEHGSHSVKDGFGGNDVIIQKGNPVIAEGTSLGQHNTTVQDHPGNSVQIHQLAEVEVTEVKVKSDTVGKEITVDTVEEGVTIDAEKRIDLLERISSHSYQELEEIAENLGLSFDSEIEYDDLVIFITESIIDAGDETDGEGDRE